VGSSLISSRGLLWSLLDEYHFAKNYFPMDMEFWETVANNMRLGKMIRKDKGFWESIV
jgi:hypothetical protein